MRNAMGRKFWGGLLTLLVVAALACGKKPQAPAADEKAGPEAAAGAVAGPAASLTASAFELKMRILQGGREKPAIPNRPVTSSYLEFLTFANFEDEENVATDERIKKVFNLTDIDLLTETTLVWEKGKTDKAFHMFRINGGAYLVMVTPGRLPERNQFRIEVYEQSGDELKTSLLNTEFSLPDKSSAVFGFEDSKLKSYFITLKVARWLGEPAAAGAVGGVAGGILKPSAVEKVKPPKLIIEVKPTYPEEAKKSGAEGVVILEATTDTYGRIAAVKVLRGDPLLAPAAVEALEQWVFEPMVINGKPRPVVFTVTMRFTLDDKNQPEVSGAVAGVVGGVEGGVEGGVAGGVAGGIAGSEDQKRFEGDAVRAVGDIQPPKLIKQVAPVYPEEARKAGVEGVVILEAKADEQGNVVDARILRSVDPLDNAALAAVRQWKYEPLVIAGKARKVLFTVTVRFTLKDGEKAKMLEKFAAGAVKAEGAIEPPKLVEEVVPVYPEAARVAGVQGVVILSVRTDATGKVADTIVLRSIPLLDQAAIDAVRQWVYEPKVIGGQTVSVVFTVTVRFVLK